MQSGAGLPGQPRFVFRFPRIPSPDYFRLADHPDTIAWGASKSLTFGLLQAELGANPVCGQPPQSLENDVAF